MRKAHQRRHFWASTQGATTVEFALVIIPFLVMMGAIFETALVSIAKVTFDNAVASVARDSFGANGTWPDASGFRGALCQSPALMLANCNDPAETCIAATSTSYEFPMTFPIPQCNGANYAVTLGDCCTVVTVEYPIPTLFDFVGWGMNLLSGGNTPSGLSQKKIRATTIVRSW